MKVIKCRVQVNVNVINQTEDIGAFIKEHHWSDFEFDTVFGIWANTGALTGITRHIVDDDKLDIFFVLNDEFADAFLSYFLSLEKLQNYWIAPGPAFIDIDENNIMSLFDEQEYTNIWTKQTYSPLYN